MVTREGKLKISDLGLAKEMGQIDITAADAAMGTPTHMAPETFQPGKPIGPTSDIYSLGIVLYELMTGRPPFTGPLNQVIHGHLYTEPTWTPQPGMGGPGFTPGTLQILKTMLAKDPGDRPATCLEVVDRISHRLRSIQGAPASAPITGMAPVGKTDHLWESSGMRKMGEFLEKNLGSSTSEYQGKTVVHTTWRERLVVWMLLGAFGLGLIALWVTQMRG
jgi:serine/threonine protein kinase